ncbi:MAG TPA: hypothetical protein VIT45_04100 [Allosphingosinicella sp.]
MKGPAFFGLLATLLLSAPITASAQPAVGPGRTDDAALKLPPLQFSAIQTFADAIAAENEAARIIDSFCQPAIAALVASNPDKAEIALSFAARERAAELALYEPLLAFSLDRHAVDLLAPDLRRRADTRIEAMKREIDSGTLSQERRQALSAEFSRMRSDEAAFVNKEVLGMARLALTPDGLALRELNRKGLYRCFDSPNGPSSFEERAECAEIEKSPALKRLRKARFGEQLIRFSTEAHVQLISMVAMGHAAGISLHTLLPPEKVSAAGLKVPADLSLEELASRHRQRPGEAS